MIVPVGPSRRPPTYDAVLDMVRTCGERHHSDAAVRTTLDEAALRCGRTVESEVLGRYDLIDEERYAGRVAVPTTRQQLLLVRRGLLPLAGGEAALWNLLMERPRDMQHVCEGTISLWRLQANELADEQAKKGSALHLCVEQFEQSFRASASFRCWLTMFLGRLDAFVKFRGWSDVAPRV